MRMWTDALGNPIECIHRYDRNIVGFTHPNKRGVDRMSLVAKLQKGTKLLLVPEPNNAFDRNAVLVYAADDPENDIGYLHSSAAKYISKMMECGATFSAEVTYIHHGHNNYPEVSIYIYHLTPMTQKRRPVRKGAPVYKPASPDTTKQSIVEESSRPIFESHKEQQTDGSLWTRIIKSVFG